MKAEKTERLDREKTLKEITAMASKTTASQATATQKTKVKVASRTVVKKRKGEDFWINISVVLFISLCLLFLGWEALLKMA
ncbi:hypothetical protein GCM10010919_23690 [Alishewanella longhuensis]|uniref:Uncharacterized protein n=1 Tax=Alishewanella longhuensis TaxID=1091037 RepID=A0ABQ3KZV3_9ALTE|nr:hypothetical protein [Alishewanella longhuensis]GHG71868.1 hypothetical protein GCM10010919_23690 [Alishewanella longhuensis]